MILFIEIIIAILLLQGCSMSNMATQYNAYNDIQAGLRNGGLQTTGGQVLGANTNLWVPSDYKSPTTPTILTSQGISNYTANGSTGNVTNPVSSGGGGPQPGQNGYINPNTLNNNDVNAQINDAYNSSYDYFNQAENNLKSQLPGITDQINQNYDLNAKMLGDQNTSNINQLNYQQDTANQSNQSQQSAIQRLYSELGQGYQQRFGGSTSAGQAASEIANVEQQRQTGQLAQKYNDTIKQIQMQQADVQQKYNTGLLQLQQQKQQFIAQAQQDFTNNLLQITQARAQTDQAKAQAKLSALMDLRNKIFTIEQQNIQFQQTLQAQATGAQQQIQTYADSVTGNLGTASNVTNTFKSAPKVTTNLQTNSNKGNTQANPYVGNMGGVSTTNDPLWSNTG